MKRLLMRELHVHWLFWVYLGVLVTATFAMQVFIVATRGGHG